MRGKKLRRYRHIWRWPIDFKNFELIVVEGKRGEGN